MRAGDLLGDANEHYARCLLGPSGQSVAAGYENDIDQYLTDVAAASGSQTNVYSVATQYYDSTGFIGYVDLRRVERRHRPVPGERLP